MFNLEKAIQQWLRAFRKHRAFDHGSIREMELHLRDHIEDLMAQGYDEQEAFGMAVAEFGDISTIAGEEFRNHQRRTRTLTTIAHSAMVKTYYFTAIRHFFKHRNYFLINLSGLAIGIACFVSIALYVANELSYDRFHSNHENIYRVNVTSEGSGLSTDMATTHSPLARTLLTDYPEVMKATRVLRAGSFRMGTEREQFSEDGILFADSNFFDVFDFKLLSGNPKTALVNPRSLVLTESQAKKYFRGKDPIGQQITVEGDTIFYNVTGVVADVPANSHLQFDMLGSLTTNEQWNGNGWFGIGVHTYVVLRADAHPKTLEKKLQEVVYEYIAPEIERYSGLTMEQWENAGGRMAYYLVPLKNIHLYSSSTEELEPGGNIAYIYLYALIAVVILFIGIFNFVNMATAQSALRAKEVGVRKVIGSTKAALIFQFMVESVIVSLFATFLAGILVMLFKPWLVALIGKALAFSITSHYLGLLALLVLAIVVGLLAGCYPAFVLSAFQPVDVLKGSLNRGSRAGRFRNFLVVAQFTASIAIIIGTLVVYRQLDFMLEKNLGFDKEQIFTIRRPDVLKGNLQAFRNELLGSPAITAVATSTTIPGKPHSKRSYRINGNSASFVFNFNQVSIDYLKTMGLKLVSGRFFSREHRLDSKAVVINAAAAKALGFHDPIGKTLTSPWHEDELLTIIGVVSDFTIESLHKNVDPVVMELMPDDTNMDGYITIKIGNSHAIRETILWIENVWSRHSHGALLESFFFDDDYENLYRSEFTTARVLTVFAVLSIVIACLGLVGLLAFTASVRSKEIGIRKILGAGAGRLIKLLSADVAKVIVAATLLAWPVAYAATEYWLRNFAVRVDLNPWLYPFATLTVVVMCGVAICFQVLKAVTANPVHALRQE